MQMGKKLDPLVNLFLGAALLAGACSGASLLAKSTESSPASTPAQATSPTPASAGTTSASAKMQTADPAGKPAAATAYRNQPNRLSNRAAAYYESTWGIEAPSVKAVESGVMLRFSFRVLDPEKAKPLNDKKIEPYLVSPEKGLRLEIPSLEKVGKLRQTSTPEAGKSYWMAFSNTGRPLKRGDRVDVVIGNFHAEGLLIE